MAKAKETVEIRPLEIVKATVRIVGDTPLIMHKWSVKAKREILDKQMKVAKANGKARDAKDPVADFIDSMYWMDGEPLEKNEKGFVEAIGKGARFGFPVTAIKQATVTSAYRCGYTKDMASLRGAFFITGYGDELLVEVKGSRPKMREDMVRVGMGTADIRHRGQFDNWYIDLEISYNKNGVYTLEQIVNLINLGGYSGGIGEWRPEKDGQNGQYHVESVSAAG